MKTQQLTYIVLALALATGMSRAASAAPAHDLTDVKLTQSGQMLMIDVTAAEPWNFDTLLVFLRSDRADAPVYEPTGRAGAKFDLVIQGPALFEYAGQDNAWQWSERGGVKTSVNGGGRTYHIEVPLASLKSKKLSVGAWAMSPDWQSVVDIAPEEGTKSIDLKNDPGAANAGANESADMALARANRSLPSRERFAQAKSYYCYYGPDHVAELSHYDALILHVPAMAPQNVKKLKELGVVTIGYVSVGEDETLRDGNGKGPGGKASWYFDRNKDGEPDRNGTWGSVFANANDPLWRADRVAEAKRLTGEYGFEGIFLDTIEVPDIYPESRPGMIQLVQELRAAIPDKVIVANRAFNLLKEPAVASNIDGVMYESFTTSYDFGTKTYIHYSPPSLDGTRRIANNVLVPVMQKYKLRILALDYALPEDAEGIQMAFDRAVTFGFLPAVSPISLDRVYRTDGVFGKRDEKYLQALATSENMKVTLSAARNGFPAGTSVTPDSCFMGYTAAAVVDGIKDRSKLEWSVANWASAEDNSPHWLLIDFSSPIQGGKLRITFAQDGGQWYPSKKFRVEHRAPGANADNAWQAIKTFDDNHSNDLTVALPAKPIGAVRIVQEPDGGSDARPELMWVGQVEYLRD